MRQYGSSIFGKSGSGISSAPRNTGKGTGAKVFFSLRKAADILSSNGDLSQNGRADHRNYEGAEGQTDTDSSLVGSDDTDDSPIFHAFLEISRPDQGCGANKMVRLYILETHDAADTG